MAVVMGLGFCFNDFPRNGILLPNTYAHAAAFDLPYHSGSHPRYNLLVIDMLVRLTSHLDYIKNPVAARNALALVRYAQARLRVVMYQDLPVSIDRIHIPRVVKSTQSVERAFATMAFDTFGHHDAFAL